jgi:hypothetical protein
MNIEYIMIQLLIAQQFNFFTVILIFIFNVVISTKEKNVVKFVFSKAPMIQLALD